MPSLKRNMKDAPDRTGFEVWDGPSRIPQGIYEGVIKSVKVQLTKAGDHMYRLLVELDDKTTDRKAQTVGFPAFGNLVLMDKEALLAREKQFYRAVTGKQDVDDINVVFDDGIDDGPVRVTKIGGKNPVGVRVKVEIQDDNYNGNEGSNVNAVYPLGKPTAKTEPVEEPEDSVEESEEEETDAKRPGEAGRGEEVDEIDLDARGDELRALGIAALRKIAKGDYEIDTTDLKKTDLIEAILDHEFGEEEEESEPDDEEDDEEEDEAEEEDDEEELLSKELAGLDRAALRAKLKELDSTATTKKSESDDDIRTRIIALAIADQSDDEDEEEDDRVEVF